MTYTEAIGKDMIINFNDALRRAISGADGKIFIDGIVDTASKGLTGNRVDNREYLEGLLLDREVIAASQAIERMKTDATEGLRELNEVSEKLRARLILSYIGGFAKETDYKPEVTEEDTLKNAVRDLYNKWTRTTPEEEQERRDKAA